MLWEICKEAVVSH